MVRVSRGKYTASRTQGNEKDIFKRIFRTRETAVITWAHYWVRIVKAVMIT